MRASLSRDPRNRREPDSPRDRRYQITWRNPGKPDQRAAQVNMTPANRAFPGTLLAEQDADRDRNEDDREVGRRPVEQPHGPGRHALADAAVHPVRLRHEERASDGSNASIDPAQ